jgi:hypothetical protein
MGLLDDAIREHLELKRRHGADPDEVSRQEEEVLGAAQSAEFAPTGDEAVEADAEPPPAAEAPDPDRTAAVAASSLEADEIDPPPEPEEAIGADEDPWLADARDEVPAEETLERPVAAEPEAQSGEESEDVLEETPEFLQETPEHDRLWFEQRPPRDFDWDK